MITHGIYLALIVLLVAGLGSLLLWSLRRREAAGDKRSAGESLEAPGHHIVYLAQVRRALDEKDYDYLKLRGTQRLSRRVTKERKLVLLHYVSALQSDFDRLLRLARVIATLSPEVAPAQEWERLRLSLWFSLRCRALRLKILLGWRFLPQLDGVSQTVSGLALRLERAMSELGERAAMVSELASPTK